MSQTVWPRLCAKMQALTLTEWLVLTAIVATLAALLLPPVQWASSGDIEVPVIVTVFDARTGQPIRGARVAIVRGPSVLYSEMKNDYAERVAPRWQEFDREEFSIATDVLGTALTLQKITTGASSQRPEPYGHVNFYWVLVSAPGYGASAIPLRCESMPTKTIKAMKTLPVAIGLSPDSGR